MKQAGSCEGGENLLLKIYKELVVIRKELQIIRNEMESEKSSDDNYQNDIEDFLQMIERMRVQAVKGNKRK